MARDPFEFNYDTDHPISVKITETEVIVTLADGRTIGNPLDWHSWLRDASPEQQQNAKIGVFSVDWPDFDEGLDIQGMLLGVRPGQPKINA